VLVGAASEVQTILQGWGDLQGADGKVVIVGSANDLNSELLVSTFSDLASAVRGDAKRTHVVACDAMLDRTRAVSLLAEASALGLRVFAPDRREGRLEGVRPWSLRDVLSPIAASHLTDAERAFFRGRRVLVTGAGGSIGSSLVAELAACGPEWLGLLDYSEYNLFQIEHALRAHFPQVSYTAMLCDVRDGEGVRRWFERRRPDVVFHTAALKHVPIVEMHACEGMLTNVGGARNVAKAAQRVGADCIFVSTDKAVNPANVMGATKRLGEMLSQAMDLDGGSRHIPVRLGNVLGSAGSVSPLFAAQIAQGGPVTVTHPDVTRYFITIQQAAEFLLLAAVSGLSDGQARGLVRTLEMGELVPVLDLARIMIQLAGLRPEVDIPIVMVGLRPGEKLEEQLIADGEAIVAADATGVNAVRSPTRDLRSLDAEVDQLLGLARSGRDELAASALHRAVTGPKLEALAG